MTMCIELLNSSITVQFPICDLSTWTCRWQLLYPSIKGGRVNVVERHNGLSKRFGKVSKAKFNWIRSNGKTSLTDLSLYIS